MAGTGVVLQYGDNTVPAQPKRASLLPVMPSNEIQTSLDLDRWSSHFFVAPSFPSAAARAPPESEYGRYSPHHRCATFTHARFCGLEWDEWVLAEAEARMTKHLKRGTAESSEVPAKGPKTNPKW